ncbi:GNAT family N-acetyltransferase [Lactovum odontotermitis]
MTEPQYITNQTPTFEAMSRLRASVNWDVSEGYRQRTHAPYPQTACYADGELIAYLEVLSDGKTDAYLQDLMVKPEFQNQGIASKLLNDTISQLKMDGLEMISLIYARTDLAAFYEKFGFFTMAAGQMEVKQNGKNS